MSFKIVVASWNAAKWLPACLASIESQTNRDFKACVVVDGSTDDSAEIVLKFASEHPDNFTAIINEENGCTLKSQRQAIEALDCEDDDVLVWLDGDDCFSGPDVLATLAGYYEDPKLLVTYGSYRPIPADRGCAPSRPYPDACIRDRDFRNVKRWGFQFNHLRTMRYLIYRNIGLDYVSWPDGTLFKVGGDAAEMVAALEMAGKGRFKYLDEVLMYYTSNNANSDWRLRAAEINRTHAQIMSMKKKDLL